MYPPRPKNPQALAERTLRQFRELVRSRMGLEVRPKDLEQFTGIIFQRMQFLRMAQPEDYYNLLETDSARSRLEWEDLAIQLTVGESYFFRDDGQFALLEQVILPRLLAANQARRTLRLWSAGCSTGEEPYSLAMLLDRVLPDQQDWQILILGTDINQEALTKARRGLYPEWSFRKVPRDLRKRYFRLHQQRWEIDPGIKKRVNFLHGNLLEAALPDYVAGIHDLDLIICRNVFIYFDRHTIALALDKLLLTLKEGGYLLTGHGELHGISHPGLRARVHGEGMIFQKAGARPVKPMKAISPPPPPAAEVQRPLPRVNIPVVQASRPAGPALPAGGATLPAATPGPPPLLTQAAALLQQKAYVPAIEKLEGVLKDYPGNLEALALLAEAHANLSRYEEARQYCRQALDLDRLAVRPYYLLAHIAQEQGQREEARDYLKKAIYLQPRFVEGYLDLADLHEAEGDELRAKQLRSTALKLLLEMPIHTTMDAYEGITAARLAVYVKKMLED